jgi:hypothetical protein
MLRSAWSRSGLSMEIPAPTDTEFSLDVLLIPKETLFPCLALHDKPKKECCEVAKLLPSPVGSVENSWPGTNSGGARGTVTAETLAAKPC